MGKAAWRIPPEPISEERIEQTYEADVVIVGACVASTVGEVVDTGVLVGKSQPLSFR